MTRRWSIAGWARRAHYGKERSRWYLLFRFSIQRRSRMRSRIFSQRTTTCPGRRSASCCAAAGVCAAADKGRSRLDRDHLLQRPLSAILALEDLSDSLRTGLVDLTERLSTRLAEWDGLSWTRCHGDCHGYNANIALQGPRT